MILYSFRRCPYAMRARLVLTSARAEWEHREILLRDKPSSMLEYSPKGTVPVLVLEDRVIDESLDIILWALDTLPGGKDLLLPAAKNQAALKLIQENDSTFKSHLDGYKYAKADEESEREWAGCQIFILKLDKLLRSQPCLFGEAPSFADYAVFPFLRQCRKVNEAQFDSLPTAHVGPWMQRIEESELFETVMKKYPLYEEK